MLRPTFSRNDLVPGSLTLPVQDYLINLCIIICHIILKFVLYKCKFVFTALLPVGLQKAVGGGRLIDITFILKNGERGWRWDIIFSICE